MSDEVPEFVANIHYQDFNYNVKAMREALPILGEHLLKNINRLNKLQTINKDIFSLTTKEFESFIHLVEFSEDPQYLKLAALCKLYKVEKREFLDMVSLMRKGVLPSNDGIILTKDADNMPEVFVKYINPNTKSNYYLVKLPSHNLRALMLGSITGNCQTLSDGYADPFIIDGITLPNNGFYVIIKQGKKNFDPYNIDWDSLEKNGHEIIGQSYAWIGRDNKTITLEAPIIIQARAHNIAIKEILHAFGKAIEEKGFDRLTMGKNSGLNGVKDYIPGAYDDRIIPTESHSISKEGLKYWWSMYEHYEFYISSNLAALRAKMPKEFALNITSVMQGECLVEFVKDKNFSPLVQKALMSCYLTKKWSLEKLQTLLTMLEEKSESQLEFILQQQTLYKYGLTIEYALMLPLEVLKLLADTIKVSNSNYFLSILHSFDELTENIHTAKSIHAVKREALKLIDKNFNKTLQDDSYIDSMPEDKVDFLSETFNGAHLL